MKRRRGGTIVLRCVAPGCTDDDLFDWQTSADWSRIEAQRKTHLCVLHRAPHEWLRPDQPRTEKVLIATRLPHLPDHLFWVEEGGTTGSGFAHGPGFRADTAYVVEGTRLRVIATLEQP